MNARTLLKTDGIIRVAPDDTLATAISALKSSHDAAFVFEGERYIGVVNPYYALIRNSAHTGKSLVRQAIFHPPRLSPDDTPQRITDLMVHSRLHYLPVCEGKKFLGIVSAKRMLGKIADEKIFRTPVLTALQQKNKALVTVYADDLISKVVHLFETEDVSKLVVIDKAMKLQGIMSYHDLVPHLLAPVRKTTKPYDLTWTNLDAFANLKVKNVMRRLVHTRTSEATLGDCLHDIVTRDIGSVVIVNAEGVPSGIVTVRDFLRFMCSGTVPESIIELTTNDLSPGNMQVVQDYGVHLDRWVRKIPNLSRAHLLVKEEKNGGLFQAKITLIPKAGKSTIFTAEGKDLLSVLKKINKRHNPIERTEAKIG
ncbi:MAG: CBS domain-containing protein [Patescibacteria group bacterium]|nr:CBS domain-containing protein [Patescibacteria group bacterium]